MVNDEAISSRPSGVREACDRCHDLKSRCIKPPNSSVCSRCHRLQLRCTHSPPLRLGRPSNKRQRHHAANASADMIRLQVDDDGDDDDDDEAAAVEDENGNDYEYENETSAGKPSQQRRTLGVASTTSSVPRSDVALQSKHMQQGAAQPGPNDDMQQQQDEPPNFHATSQDGLDTATASLIMTPSAMPTISYDDATIAIQWQPTISPAAAVGAMPSSDLNRTSLAGMESWLDSSHWLDDLSPPPPPQPPPSSTHELNVDHPLVSRQTGQPTLPPALHGRDTLERLLDLQRELGAICELSSSSSSRPLQEMARVDDLNDPGHRQAPCVNIEMIFGATESLIDIVSCPPPAPPLGQRSQLDTPPASHLDWRPDSSSNSSNMSTNTTTPHSTVLLVLSSYMRLLDIYDSLVDHLRGNGSHIQAQNHIQNHHQHHEPNALGGVAVPLFAVGGFKLATASGTNVVMVVHAVLEMVARLQIVIHVYVSAAAAEGGSGSGGRARDMRQHHHQHHQHHQAGARSDFHELPKDQAQSVVPSAEPFLQHMLSGIGAQEQHMVGKLSTLKHAARQRTFDSLSNKFRPLEHRK